jgi:HTH-type transcriptional regulator/antitoxin HigA
MDIKPIKDKRDYQRTLREIEELMHAKRHASAGDRLDVLVVLVEAWEANNIRAGSEPRASLET